MAGTEGLDSSASFELTEDWFSRDMPTWDPILTSLKPRKILEIGSFEGRSACYLIEKCADLADGELSITCADSWQGGCEHQQGGMAEAKMNEVERRFDHNMRLALRRAARPVTFCKLKQNSCAALAGLITAKLSESFDLIYVDGSHEAPNVLSDAVMAFA